MKTSLRGRALWLAVLPLLIAGSEGAQAVLDRFTSASYRGAELLAPSHSSVLLGLAGIGALLLESGFVGHVVSGCRSRRLSVWIFALLPSLLYVAQEHVEYWIGHASLAGSPATQSVFLLGLALQAPFTLAAYIAARLLLRLASAVVARRRPQQFASEPSPPRALKASRSISPQRLQLRRGPRHPRSSSPDRLVAVETRPRVRWGNDDQRLEGRMAADQDPRAVLYAGAASGLRAWHQVDWRFVLPDPHLGPVCLGPDCAGETTMLGLMGVDVVRELGDGAEVAFVDGVHCDLAAIERSLPPGALVRIAVGGSGGLRSSGERGWSIADELESRGWQVLSRVWAAGGIAAALSYVDLDNRGAVTYWWRTLHRRGVRARLTVSLRLAITRIGLWRLLCHEGFVFARTPM